jgi:hypothetical protein
MTPLAPGTFSPTENAPCLSDSLFTIVAHESLGNTPMLVASSEIGNVVIAIDDGSDDTTATDGVHSEQNMLRVASCVPSFVRCGFAGAVGTGTGAAGGRCGACAGSPRYFASMMWPTAFAANTAQTITTMAPITQK